VVDILANRPSLDVMRELAFDRGGTHARAPMPDAIALAS
jgi:hypothetical protein